MDCKGSVFTSPCDLTVILQGFYGKHDKGKSVFVSLKFGTTGIFERKIQPP